MKPTEEYKTAPDQITDPIGKVKVLNVTKEEDQFSESRAKALYGLMRDGTFLPVNIQYI